MHSIFFNFGVNNQYFMSDEVIQVAEQAPAEQVSTPAEAPVLTAEQIDFNRNMEIALSDEFPAPTQPATEEPPNPDIPLIPETPAVAKTGKPVEPPVVDYFGFPTMEEAKAEFESLKALKESVGKPIDADPVRLKEIYTALDRQEKLGQLLDGEVTKDNAGAIIKASMIEKYKGLSADMVNHKFNKTWNIPTKPKEDSFVDTDEYDIAVSEWQEKVNDIEMDMVIEANLVRPDLEKIKSEIKIPNIQSPAVVDKDYEDWKASQAQAIEASEKVLQPAINSLKEADLLLNLKVEDSGNQMDFDVAITPTKEALEKAKTDALDVFGYIVKNCNDEKGNFMPEKLVRMFLLDGNFDNYAQSMCRQAVNAERARVIAKEAPNGATGGKDFNVNVEKTQFQKDMELALS